MRLNFASFDESETCIGKRSKKSIGVPRLNFAGFRRRYNSALKQCGTKGFAFVRFGALCCAGAPPPVRRASLQAARRVGAPRPEAQPARARPQAGARGCAEPEEQGDTAQPVTAALLLRRVCRSRCGQADRIAVLQLFRFCADTLPTERCEFVLLSPSYYIK